MLSKCICFTALGLSVSARFGIPLLAHSGKGVLRFSNASHSGDEAFSLKPFILPASREVFEFNNTLQ